MSSRRMSLAQSCSMFQTSTEPSAEASLYQTNSSVKPPIFVTSHSITPRRASKDMLRSNTSAKGARSTSVCVPSESLHKIAEKTERSLSIEGLGRNKRLSISTQGNLEIGQITERKLSMANMSDQFSSFVSMSSKMGVQVVIVSFRFSSV